jgi:hypothetical protein
MASVQIVIGAAWAMALVWLFLALSVIADPVSTTAITLYWGPLFLGPALLALGGAAILLRTTRLRASAVITALGSAAITASVLVWLVPGMVEELNRGELQNVWVTAPFAVSAVLSDLIAVKLNKTVWLRAGPERES